MVAVVVIVRVIGRHGFAEFLCAVVLVEEIVGNFLQVREVGVQQCGADGEEVRVARVVDFDNTPRVCAGADAFAFELRSRK